MPFSGLFWQYEEVATGDGTPEHRPSQALEQVFPDSFEQLEFISQIVKQRIIDLRKITS